MGGRKKRKIRTVPFFFSATLLLTLVVLKFEEDNCEMDAIICPPVLNGYNRYVISVLTLFWIDELKPFVSFYGFIRIAVYGAEVINKV